MRVRNQRVDFDLVATILEKAKRDSGKSFEGWQLHDMTVVLRSAIAFDDAIPDTQCQRIINDAVFDVAKSGQITGPTLLGTLQRAEGAYLALPIQAFVVVTSLSIAYFDLLPKITYRGRRIDFYRYLPSRFDRAPLKGIHGYPATPIPEGYTTVTIRTTGRSVHEAFQSGMEQLDLLRGIWILSLLWPVLASRSWGRPQPISPIRLGPCHTVHRPDGTLPNEIYWYPTDYTLGKPTDLAAKSHRVEKEFRLIRGRLRRLPFGHELERLFARYARALEPSDLDTAFLKLWGLLEALTNTTGSSYDITLRRTLFAFQEDVSRRLILEHLRDYRNGAIHHDRSLDQTELLAYQLKRYVDTLLHFHISWAGEFKSIGEAGQFMDLPQAVIDLKQRARWARLAARFRAKSS